MYNYYILESEYDNVSINCLYNNLLELHRVLNDRDKKYDHFLYSDNLWLVNIEDGITFSEYLFSNNKIKDPLTSNFYLSLFQQYGLSSVPRIIDKDDYDNTYPNKNNAFWGTKIDPKESYYLSTKKKYDEFREATKFNHINFQNLLEYQSLLFKNIRFCDKAESNMKELGKSFEFDPIISSLQKLDKTSKHWMDKGGDLGDIADKYGLTITGESEPVRKNPKRRLERMYDIPKIGSQFVQDHIKINDISGPIRIYIYLDKRTHIVYVCEIGRHKATVKY